MSSQRMLQKCMSLVAVALGCGLIFWGVGSASGATGARVASSSGAVHRAAAKCAVVPRPGHLTIASRCVDAPLVGVGISHNTVTIPTNVHVVGWFKNTPSPNASAGSTVVVGHVNYVTQGPGAFYQLWFVPMGSIVRVNFNGHVHSWRVVSRQYVPKWHLSWDLFSQSGPRYLTLITCGGQLRSSGGGWHYADNVVVRAVPIN